MKKVYLEDLVDYVGEDITELFYVKDLLKNHNRQGTVWTTVRLVDKTGERNAKIWSEFNDSKFENCNNAVCRLTGKVDIYNGVAGIAITEIDRVPEEEYDMSDFSAGMSHELCNGYKKQLLAYIDKVKNPSYHALLPKIFNERNIASLCKLPAGVYNHHSFNGALLVHTLEVTRLAISAAYVNDQYAECKEYVKNKVDMDLIITGALLHDIGKITEYLPFPMARRTTRGHLVGHLAEGVVFVTSYNSLLDSSERVQDTTELNHIIMSSHGIDGGMAPATLEAVIVHNADMMSASMDAYHCAFKEEEKKHPDNKNQYAYSQMLDTKLYRRKEEVTSENELKN